MGGLQIGGEGQISADRWALAAAECQAAVGQATEPGSAAPASAAPLGSPVPSDQFLAHPAVPALAAPAVRAPARPARAPAQAEATVAAWWEHPAALRVRAWVGREQAVAEFPSLWPYVGAPRRRHSETPRSGQLGGRRRDGGERPDRRLPAASPAPIGPPASRSRIADGVELQVDRAGRTRRDDGSDAPLKRARAFGSAWRSMRSVSRTPRRSLAASSGSAASIRARPWPSHWRRRTPRFRS